MPYKDPIKRAEYHKKYNQENKWKYDLYRKSEKGKMRKKIMAKQDRKKNRDSNWARDLRRQFNCTPDQYIELMFECGALCSICKQPEKQINKWGMIQLLAVDHDHKTGKLRGLLCSNCNRGIGFLGDSIENLQAALAYITHHQGRPIQ